MKSVDVPAYVCAPILVNEPRRAELLMHICKPHSAEHPPAASATIRSVICSPVGTWREPNLTAHWKAPSLAAYAVEFSRAERFTRLVEPTEEHLDFAPVKQSRPMMIKWLEAF